MEVIEIFNDLEKKVIDILSSELDDESQKKLIADTGISEDEIKTLYDKLIFMAAFEEFCDQMTTPINGQL